MLLRRLQSGKRAKVTRITVRGELGRRLRDLGFIGGNILTVQGRAPLSDPVRIQLGEQILTLRNNEADYIEVEPVDEISEQ
jgi:ferrous iron transport protein A